MVGVEDLNQSQGQVVLTKNFSCSKLADEDRNDAARASRDGLFDLLVEAQRGCSRSYWHGRFFDLVGRVAHCCICFYHSHGKAIIRNGKVRER